MKNNDLGKTKGLDLETRNGERKKRRPIISVDPNPIFLPKTPSKNTSLFLDLQLQMITFDFSPTPFPFSFSS